MKISLTIKTYNVKYEIAKITDEDGNSKDTLSPMVNSIDKELDHVKTDQFEFDSENDNVQLKIQELSQKAKTFNNAQVKLAKMTNSKSGKWQVVTTKENNQ